MIFQGGVSLSDNEYWWEAGRQKNMPYEAEFKNKLLIVRIKANLTLTHMHNAHRDPAKK